MASYEEVIAVCEFLRKRISFKPQLGLICGSGLSKLSDGIRNPVVIPYEEIPSFPKTTVEGHIGKLVFGVMGDKYVMLMQGRFHAYEGYTQQQITLPVRVMKLMGCEYLIVTNATGGVHLNYEVGDIIVVKDHISFPTLAGLNPLIGPNDERFGPRFPAASDIYTAELRQLAFRVDEEIGIMDMVHEGVYMCICGPSYNTPAEARALHILGADVLGMSLTAETIVANHCGMRVLALSLVTDRETFEVGKKHQLSHEEVLREALHQITLDFVEDCVKRGGHCYVEPRFCPSFFTGDNLSVEEVTETILSSMEKAAYQHDLQWRAIFCMIRQYPEWSDEIVEVALKNRHKGVVAVDVAGDDKPCDGKNTDLRIKAAFKKAHDAGLHCIAHAGENGCAASVTEAVHEMYAERIGHGYHILDDEAVYEDMKARKIHFEVCPLSSHLTGAVGSRWQDHPINKFERDGISYSISTDDPTLTGQWLLAEKRMLVANNVLHNNQLKAANIRAAKASFLDNDSKKKLVQYLEESYRNF
ncbi:hypothetical protein Aperf_G00000049987 [Anoplocephala perfoliata]